MERPSYSKLRKFRECSINNARLWAFNQDISVLGNIYSRNLMTPFTEEFQWHEDKIRENLEEKLRGRKPLKIKDSDLQSFFLMWGMKLGNYSRNIDQMCSEIINAKGTSQYEDLGIEEVGNSPWANPQYHFEDDELEILKWHSCEGGYDLRVNYCKKNVFVLVQDGGVTEMDLIENYVPGKWEKKLKKLYDSLPGEDIPRIEQSESEFRFMKEFHFGKPYQPDLPISPHLFLSEEFSFVHKPITTFPTL